MGYVAVSGASSDLVRSLQTQINMILGLASPGLLGSVLNSIGIKTASDQIAVDGVAGTQTLEGYKKALLWLTANKPSLAAGFTLMYTRCIQGGTKFKLGPSTAETINQMLADAATFITMTNGIAPVAVVTPTVPVATTGGGGGGGGGGTTVAQLPIEAVLPQMQTAGFGGSTGLLLVGAGVAAWLLFGGKGKGKGGRRRAPSRSRSRRSTRRRSRR
jgi:hypothetical protein